MISFPLFYLARPLFVLSKVVNTVSAFRLPKRNDINNPGFACGATETNSDPGQDGTWICQEKLTEPSAPVKFQSEKDREEANKVERARKSCSSGSVSGVTLILRFVLCI
ncbi:hypothetical protein OIU77_011827 [Salix suchowensis]|uniref:Uncharacterized protein n=1 Tax=Salix suchowensis TaxID=1278906 RepID=A0ABQ9A395_9ROSI|nr:hypothetical protein OIU77_011827 [Salix suchowensis]